MTKAIDGLKRDLPALRETLLPGCGHWTQQERPDEVNAALVGCMRIREYEQANRLRFVIARTSWSVFSAAVAFDRESGIWFRSWAPSSRPVLIALRRR